jgi:hypothetical protein
VENIQKTDAMIEGIRRYERTKIGTSKKLAYNLGVGREQKGKTWVIWGMTGKTKRAKKRAKKGQKRPRCCDAAHRVHH